jgi:Tfp pilus assembly PilM family ATPase
VSGFAKAFHDRTGLPVAAMNPLARMIPSNRFEAEHLDDLAPALGVAVGLALRESEAR